MTPHAVSHNNRRGPRAWGTNADCLEYDTIELAYTNHEMKKKKKPEKGGEKMHLFNLYFWIHNDSLGKLSTFVNDVPLITTLDSSDYAPDRT